MARLKRNPEEANRQAEARSRLERWTARGVAHVAHPAYGGIIVPCGSKFAAVQCAADVWRCDWLAILHASVTWVPPGTKPVSMPMMEEIT